MPYTNINIGAGKSAKQDSYNAFLEQVLKNAEKESAAKGFKKQRPPVNDAIKQAYEDAGIPDDIVEDVEKAEAVSTPEVEDAKQVASAEDAARAAQNMPRREGWNAPEGQTAFTGPANVHYSDVDRVNKGLQPTRVDELRGNIESGNYEAAAEMLPYEDKLGLEENLGVIKDHETLSNFVIDQMAGLSSGFGSKNRTEFVNRIAEDINGDPRSVAEYLNTVLTDFDSLQKQGVPKAFSDAALTSVLQVLRRNKWAEYKRDEDIAKGELDVASEGNTSIAHDEEIGRHIETAFGKKDSSPQTRAITGAIARRVVTDALGGFEADGKVFGKWSRFDPTQATGFKRTLTNPITGSEAEVSPEGVVKKGLFHSRKISIGDNQDLWVTELTDKGLNYAESLNELSNIILPGLRKDVNAHPPLNEHLNPKMKSKKVQRKQDQERLAGDFKSTNEGIHALESVQNAIAENYTNRLFASLNNPEAVTLFEDKNYIELSGIEVEGSLRKRRSDGEVYKRRYIFDNQGNKIVNPNYDPNIANLDHANAYQFMTEVYLGDQAKMMNFNQDLQWFQDHLGEGFYYTYFIGGAKRVHVEQTIGNYQSSKLVRSALEAAAKELYKTNNKADMIVLKAGIMKKYGLNKAKDGNLINLAATFDGMVRGWQKAQGEFEAAGGQGFAPALIQDAAGHEGWMSLNAISEALDLQYAIDNKIPQYKTGFITEIDGLANGLAINSLQAGDETVAKLTGMLPIDENDNITLAENDVYTITTEMFKAQIEKYVGNKQSSQLGVLWDGIFEKYFDGFEGSRNISKKALMVFGYGAGGDTIKLGFKQFLQDKIDSNDALRTQIESYGGQKAVESFLNLSGDMMVNAVETNFPEMRQLAKVLSAITGYAASIGIEPHVLTDDYDYVEFGLSQRVKDEDLSMRGSYKPGFKNPRGKGQTIEIQAFKRFLDSKGIESTVNGKKVKMTFDNAVDKISKLKASKQAPVLITQSIDALVMMRALSKLRQKARSKAGFFAAQIYDGVLMTPKEARRFSDALHHEIYKISKEFSSVHSLIDSIQELDADRFHELAVLIRRRDVLGGKLTKEQEAKIAEDPMKFILAKVPWKGKGTIIQAIREIDKRRNNLIKKMDLAKMYQYAWDWPAKK